MGDTVYKMVCTKVEAGMICKNVSGLHTAKPQLQKDTTASNIYVIYIYFLKIHFFLFQSVSKTNTQHFSKSPI